MKKQKLLSKEIQLQNKTIRVRAIPTHLADGEFYDVLDYCIVRDESIGLDPQVEPELSFWEAEYIHLRLKLDVLESILGPQGHLYQEATKPFPDKKFRFRLPYFIQSFDDWFRYSEYAFKNKIVEGHELAPAQKVILYKAIQKYMKPATVLITDEGPIIGVAEINEYITNKYKDYYVSIL